MKDSYWFKHDSSAGRDIKLLEIAQIYTHWGKGIFWDVIEVLREQDEYKFKINKLQVLCGIIYCNDYVKFQNWYNDCLRVGLFKEVNGYFYSESLLNRMKVWESKKSSGLSPKLKAKPKRNRSETEANREDKIREDNIIVEYKDNRIKEAWERWIDFKNKQFKFKYKTTESEQIAINEFIKLCNDDYSLAEKIVNQSISKGWKGLFEYKPISKTNYMP